MIRGLKLPYPTSKFMRNFFSHLRMSTLVASCIATSAKCILVTGSLCECLRVVGPESHGGQIPEFTGLMQWPLGAPGSTWERRPQAWERRPQAWEHIESLESNLRNHNPLWEHCGAPGNRSYCLMFNHYQNSCVHFVFSSLNL